MKDWTIKEYATAWVRVWDRFVPFMIFVVLVIMACAMTSILRWIGTRPDVAISMVDRQITTNERVTEMISIEQITPWAIALETARGTVNKSSTGKEPSTQWIRKILKAEHSPIRNVWFKLKLIDIPHWVSVHLVRHKVGVEHFVGTSRSDRTGIPRDKLPQDNPTTHRMVLNAQAFINISRKRLCQQASMETRLLWEDVMLKVKEHNPELYDVCVPECIYRGFCPEIKSCGLVDRPEYAQWRFFYRDER